MLQKLVNFTFVFTLLSLPWMAANAKPTPERADCYTTELGVQVQTEVLGACPDKEIVEEETAEFLSRYGAGHASMKGLNLVLVPQSRTPAGVVGIMWSENEVWVVDGFRTRIFRQIYAHEMAHALLARTGFWAGWLHCGYDDKGWMLKALCANDPYAEELISAAEAVGRDTPMLSKESRFYKVFKDFGTE